MALLHRDCGISPLGIVEFQELRKKMGDTFQENIRKFYICEVLWIFHKKALIITLKNHITASNNYFLF